MRRPLFVLGWIIALGFFDHHFAWGAEIWGPFVKKQGGKECLPLKGQHPPYPVMDERYLCILAGVSGEFKGGGEAVRVYFDDKNPQAKQWNLCVRSKQIGVLGEAYCFSRDSFLTDTDQGGVRMLSEEFKSTVTPSGGCNGREAPVWLGDAATFISGISGKTEGRGESVQVAQAESTANSKLRVHSCQNWLGGWAYSFFVGKPHTGSVLKQKTELRQLGPPGGCPPNEVYLWATRDLPANGLNEASLIPVVNGMCYLTKISGKFQGGGEYVGLGQMEDGDPRRMHWTFKVRAKNEQGVGGCMRCIDFDQR